MTRISALLCICLALVSLAGATGCSKPSINLAVASQPNVNPDFSGRPSPVVVKMYELRQEASFMAADFQPLFETPVQVLGADLIAADELVFTPGEARKVTYEPNGNTRFIGIVAGFRQMERGVWRVVKPVDAESGNWVAMELTDTSILLVPDKDAKKWEPTEAVRTYQQSLPQNLPQDMPQNRSAQDIAGKSGLVPKTPPNYPRPSSGSGAITPEQQSTVLPGSSSIPSMRPVTP